jgi:type IV secretion system protein TrbE
LIPWSATFTGHLEDAEAIYNGARGNLVGIRTRLGNTPQHGVLFGMTGAGKSVIIADLLAQIGHRFGFRLIVEEGLSHAVLTQTQGKTATYEMAFLVTSLRNDSTLMFRYDAASAVVGKQAACSG